VSALRLNCELLLQGLPKESHHFDFILGHMEFLIVYENLVANVAALTCKLFNFLLFRLIVVPIRILTAAGILLVFFAQG
jgi:hypothetical protein